MDTLRRRVRLSLCMVLAAIVSVGPVAPPANAIPREVREKVIPATVKIYALDDDLRPVATGSGSILTATGQILTNFHVVADEAMKNLENKDGIVLISITSDPRKNPVPSFLGKVVRSNPKLDLALVTVVSDLTGKSLAGCLVLPTYPIGDSDKMAPGDDVAVIGFPGIGGSAVTYTEGKIAGFEEGSDGPWLKTDAEVNHGNSGGSAIDDAGNLIGVPSAGRSDPEAAGKISLIRPINSAGEVIKGVAGLGVPGCGSGGGLGAVPSTGKYGPYGLGFQGFATTANAKKPVDSAPSGSTELYGYFKYYGVPANTPVKYEWLLNGQPTGKGEQSDAWPYPVDTGEFTLSLVDPKGLADGAYSIRLTIGESTDTTRELTVGRTGSDGPAAQAVTIRGRVVSADTDRPIPGALFVVLKPGVSWKDFNPDDDGQVMDLARANAQGDFQTKLAFPLDERYALGVAAKGYRPQKEDGFDFAKLQPTNGFADFGTLRLKAAN